MLPVHPCLENREAMRWGYDGVPSDGNTVFNPKFTGNHAATGLSNARERVKHYQEVSLLMSISG